MDTVTANRVFWGVVVLAAVGFIFYLVIVIGSREFTSQIDKLSLAVNRQNAEIENLKSKPMDAVARQQVESLTDQLKTVAETLQSVPPQIQANQREIEQIKTQLSNNVNNATIVTRLATLESQNKDLLSSMDELKASMANVSQQVRAFDEHQQALQQVLGPVLAIDNPIPYDSTCPPGYSALEITFQIWSANTELDRLHDTNRDRLICKASTPAMTLPSLSQVIASDSERREEKSIRGSIR
ncbi:hypothetical protein HY230_00855 [Candidatus Acetothermia bacterium]|nr:hypothetical protein [Candidatus Acetothermia bacterium]